MLLWTYAIVSHVSVSGYIWWQSELSCQAVYALRHFTIGDIVPQHQRNLSFNTWNIQYNKKSWQDHVLCTGAKSCWDRTVPTTLEAENHPKCLGRHKDFSSLQLQGPGQSTERKWLRGMAKHFFLYNLCMLSSISSHCNWNCAGSFKLETQQRMITGWGEGSNAYVLIKGVGQKKTKRLVLG